MKFSLAQPFAGYYASGMYNRAVKEILDRTLDLTGTLKIMLVNTNYTYDPDHDFVDAGGGSDPLDAEIVATNYAGGHAGAGRKTATLTFVEQDANNRAVIRIGDLTWSSLGGASNDTVAAAILIKPGTSDDTDAKLIAYFDLTNTTTNGSDLTLDFDGTDGNIRFAN